MQNKKIILSDGAGGISTHNLIKNVFIKKLGNPMLNHLDDSAIFQLPIRFAHPRLKSGATTHFSLCFTTDSYVVKPIFFPGGDIGKLSVCGTINDLAVMGAKPLYISLAFILEDGLEIEKLEKIVSSIAETSKKAGVKIVCGDTKVVEKGACDEIFINTSGIGIVNKKFPPKAGQHQDENISGHNARPGDVVIISGTIADHGITVLNARQELDLTGNLKSDVAPLNNLVEKMLEVGKIHTMRDPTRGGLATTLNEIAEQSNVGIELDEKKIPIKKSIKIACEILGLDPLYIANEGKLIAVVKEEDTQKILSAMKKHPLGKNSKIIGKIIKKPKSVYLKTKIGGNRILQMLDGDQLPRIC
ncbi:MAG TPA: hydrogenase expression/formation protein HypE [Elusimicrobia bacterium]|nr:hydrogenase expression/formation protein HypE [Elusimicrobiota bacterium]